MFGKEDFETMNCNITDLSKHAIDVDLNVRTEKGPMSVRITKSQFDTLGLKKGSDAVLILKDGKPTNLRLN